MQDIAIRWVGQDRAGGWGAGCRVQVDQDRAGGWGAREQGSKGAGWAKTEQMGSRRGGGSGGENVKVRIQFEAAHVARACPRTRVHMRACALPTNH